MKTKECPECWKPTYTEVYYEVDGKKKRKRVCSNKACGYESNQPREGWTTTRNRLQKIHPGRFNERI